MPNLLEYFSFVCFCCGSIVGPFIEFSHFKNWIELSGNYKTMPRSGTIGPALLRILHGIMCLALHIVFVMILGYSVYYCGSKDYLKSGGLFSRYVYYFIAMTGQRFMYYTPWCFCDASVIACGISWDQKGKNWERIVSIYIYDLETSGSCMEMMRYWNH